VKRFILTSPESGVSPKSIESVFLAVFGTIAVLVFIVPYTEPYGAFTALDGTVGYIDHADLWGSANPIAGIVYAAGDLLCHQQMARTFILNGSEMPFCSRDVALLVGFVIGLAFTVFGDMSRIRRKYVAAFVCASFLLIIADWSVQNVMSLNVAWTRVATGLLAGVAVSFVLDAVICRYALGKG
jgi:uncharacterized membrane protein